jgi:hypothetical protein
MESDVVCVGCHQPLEPDGPAKPKRTPIPLHAKLTLAFTVLGAVLGLMVGFAFFPSPPPKPGASGGSNWPAFIGIGGGIGAIIGYALGVLVFEKDEPRVVVPVPPVTPAPEAEAEEPAV